MQEHHQGQRSCGSHRTDDVPDDLDRAVEAGDP